MNTPFIKLREMIEETKRPKRQPASTLTRRTGCEGPHHDPYAFTEYTLTRQNGASLTVHVGLGEWLSVNDGPSVAFTQHVDEALRVLGLPTVRQLERWYEAIGEHRWRSHRTCRPGPDWHDGFPGESFLICSCGEHLDHHFDISAVE